MKISTSIAGHVIPDDLDPILRNREGVQTGLFEILQPVTVVDRNGSQRAFLCHVIDVLRRRGSAMSGVDRNVVGSRITLEQR
ncbi:hypothetical protein D9M70_618120 [compost metagenome]